MPNLYIEHSKNLPNQEKLAAFALQLHQEITPIINTDVESFKTRIMAIDQVVIGSDAKKTALLHIQVRINAGRNESQKKAVSDLILQQATALFAAEEVELHLSSEIFDIGFYHKAVV